MQSDTVRLVVKADILNQQAPRKSFEDTEKSNRETGKIKNKGPTTETYVIYD